MPIVSAHSVFYVGNDFGVVFRIADVSERILGL